MPCCYCCCCVVVVLLLLLCCGVLHVAERFDIEYYLCVELFRCICSSVVTVIAFVAGDHEVSVLVVVVAQAVLFRRVIDGVQGILV